jgi:hypothetical protein
MKKKLIFLHVPRTAGSSLSRALSLNTDSIIHPIQPRGAWETLTQENKAERFKFAFVRNPWDRFVSLYFYFYNMTPDHFAYKYDKQTVENIQRFKTFKDLCLNFSDFTEAQPFEKFHFFNQHLWTHHDGKCFVDFLGRYESLNPDFLRLEDIVGTFHWAGIPHRRLPWNNKSSHLNYRSHYNDTTISIVQKLYKKDIEHFEYEFGE